MINVTKTFLPPLDDYVAYLQGVWERGIVTNDGPLLRELEQQLKAHLQVKHLLLVSNGTVALSLAIKALVPAGSEIITTPFSYVATTSSIVWEGCTPVFVDIDPATFCLRPDLIEEAITDRTRAILATHVYGVPCDVEALEAIAKRHGLKVIYDAAHAFGVKYQDRSVLTYGDVSTLSFHATKLFHTGEGGALVTNDDELAAKLEYMRNFGHADYNQFQGLGINGKVSELHAAMGLCVLPQVPALMDRRRVLSEQYDALLAPCGLQRPVVSARVHYNYAYYPVVFATAEQRAAVHAALNEADIFPRRYFYPALTELPYVDGAWPAIREAPSIAERVLCLPLYHDLDDEVVERIAGIVCQHTR
ncbi:DegT/DnrJ/EryC1/StrS family aminotransferase [Hymenobacter busanensis]|uniref:DegT/DnrJ/EryC1/StrS family aminotransferase n=1 Tax=Hymenobacter busanensis TaxID=2607656 RepID=A0A7L4ZWS2_9BACT|nr:DegT/DnrJ/EryC1/StrS family aminotransferase [Hymenobacter busanensis]KAA9332357.1 DegT/DnrJ/EryC1/StrS family aminotransferase [Hymenobacter busanensis]QHJ07306.1 aminotransferase class I/II-fold pyridoxal phosphate-dependent enzyme [Hymenobacter busanensis]